MTITTRQLSGTGVTAKNAPLTHAELDQNFIDLTKGNLSTLGTLSVKTIDQLSLAGNTIYTTVFVDITEVPANTTYTIEDGGQLPTVRTYGLKLNVRF